MEAGNAAPSQAASSSSVPAPVSSAPKAERGRSPAPRFRTCCPTEEDSEDGSSAEEDGKNLITFDWKNILRVVVRLVGVRSEVLVVLTDSSRRNFERA